MGKTFTYGERTTRGLKQLLQGRQKLEPQYKRGGVAGVWMKITAATIDGSNRRWSYTVSQVEWTSGFTWTTVSNGFTGTAYNSIEVPNGATGSFGNGTSSTNFTGTFNLAPIGTNAIVFCHYIGSISDADFYAFSAVNQLEGACP